MSGGTATVNRHNVIDLIIIHCLLCGVGKKCSLRHEESTRGGEEKEGYKEGNVHVCKVVGEREERQSKLDLSLRLTWHNFSN